MKYIFILTLAAGLLGCNPTRRIDMLNHTGSKAEILFHIKEDSLHASPFYLNNTDKSGFRLEQAPPYNSIKLSMGVGPWTKAYLKDIVDDLEKMEIRTAAGEMALADAQEMEDFLWQRRHGITRRKIRIVLTK